MRGDGYVPAFVTVNQGTEIMSSCKVKHHIERCIERLGGEKLLARSYSSVRRDHSTLYDAAYAHS